MTIDEATESGWRPVTKQDLIDLIDGGEPLAARFRDTESESWRDDYLSGFRIVAGGLRYAKLSTGSCWKQCEIKTQVLRDPKFSDLDNGPIECVIYPDCGAERPQKGILVGMSHTPNQRNSTGMIYCTKYLWQKNDPNASTLHRRHVKVVDDLEPIKAETDDLPKQVEPTDDGWRTPTVEDLAHGPIECEVRDRLDAHWHKRTLEAITSGRQYPYRTINCGWRYCRIRK